MDRLEKVRELVDEIVLHMTDVYERRCAYLHLYGVSQACVLLAVKRGENAELAAVSGVLHDIYSYASGDKTDHAHQGAVLAEKLLRDTDSFSDAEIHMVCRDLQSQR